MIIKSFEINKINLDKNKFLLFYGKNEGLKNEVKNNLLKNKNLTAKYDEKEIIENSDILIEDLNSRSLFEDEKIIIVNRATDKIFKIISEIVEKQVKETIIIIDAENLEKKSKLRSFFEKNNNCICIPFYPDTDETLSRLAFDYAKRKKISISKSDINLITNKCSGDRKILFMELEKLEYYSKYGKKINSENITKLTNLIENYSISELINCCLLNNKRKTVNILIENNFNKEDCVLITRTFLNKLKRLLKLSLEFQKNKNIELTISTAKPPIFWKEKESTKQQIKNWTPEKIRKILYDINGIELSIKKNYDNSVNLVTDFILNQVSADISN